MVAICKGIDSFQGTCAKSVQEQFISVKLTIMSMIKIFQFCAISVKILQVSGHLQREQNHVFEKKHLKFTCKMPIRTKLGYYSTML